MASAAEIAAHIYYVREAKGLPVDCASTSVSAVVGADIDESLRSVLRNNTGYMNFFINITLHLLHRHEPESVHLCAIPEEGQPADVLLRELREEEYSGPIQFRGAYFFDNTKYTDHNGEHWGHVFAITSVPRNSRVEVVDTAQPQLSHGRVQSIRIGRAPSRRVRNTPIIRSIPVSRLEEIADRSTWPYCVGFISYPIDLLGAHPYQDLTSEMYASHIEEVDRYTKNSIQLAGQVADHRALQLDIMAQYPHLSKSYIRRALRMKSAEIENVNSSPN